MVEIPRYVIDASVLIKWYLEDEEHLEPAASVREDYTRGAINLLAPAQLRHEVASAVLKATRHTNRPKRLSVPEGREIIQLVLDWNIESVEHELLIPGAYELATYYG